MGGLQTKGTYQVGKAEEGAGIKSKSKKRISPQSSFDPPTKIVQNSYNATLEKKQSDAEIMDEDPLRCLRISEPAKPSTSNGQENGGSDTTQNIEDEITVAKTEEELKKEEEKILSEFNDIEKFAVSDKVASGNLDASPKLIEDHKIEFLKVELTNNQTAAKIEENRFDVESNLVKEKETQEETSTHNEDIKIISSNLEENKIYLNQTVHEKTTKRTDIVDESNNSLNNEEIDRQILKTENISHEAGTSVVNLEKSNKDVDLENSQDLPKENTQNVEILKRNEEPENEPPQNLENVNKSVDFGEKSENTHKRSQSTGEELEKNTEHLEHVSSVPIANKSIPEDLHTLETPINSESDQKSGADPEQLQPQQDNDEEENIQRIRSELLEIEKETKGLKERVLHFSETTKNGEYLRLEDLLVKNIIKLDDISQTPEEELRDESKRVMKIVQQSLQNLRNKIENAKNVEE